ncbi:MAG TPA: hypothetical protein VGO41_00455 [Steroidobacteraceae bacterium]|jgi:phospholipase/carboxylesterase|nr:hypothetical protein [Steroidobacteraceae bacterium]
MKTRTLETEDAVTLAPADGQVHAAVIWLHGLGADGHDFVPLIPELALPADARIRFVFPHAPVRPVTLNGGYAMRAWYDIKSLTPAGRDDEDGLQETAARIEAYIARERVLAVPAERILLAGFSQGGAAVLHAGLRHDEALAGILALSCYLPLRAQLTDASAEANRSTPILMCHGRDDTVVALQFGEQSRDVLLAAGYAVEFRQYPMAHSLCPAEIADIAGWLRRRLLT